MKKLPDKENLPVTEGPPVQEEPDGQELGGPHPDNVPEDLRRQAESKQLQLLVPLKDLTVPTIRSLGPLTLPQVGSDQVVTALQALLGTGESPPGSNCNAVTHRAGVGCVAWCDINWWTALFNAGFNAGGHINMPGVATDYWFGDAYVPSTEHHFEAAGRFQSAPVPGSGEIHYWSSKTRNPGDSHIAAYIKDYGDGTHLNIEGNHNNVCEYVRRPNSDSTRAGYCIPVYSSAPPPPQPVRRHDDGNMYL